MEIFKKIFSFNFNEISVKMVRLDYLTVAFVKFKSNNEITDTTFFDLEKKMIDSLRNM